MTAFLVRLYRVGNLDVERRTVVMRWEGGGSRSIISRLWRTGKRLMNPEL